MQVNCCGSSLCPSLRAGPLTQEAIPHLHFKSFHDKPPCETPTQFSGQEPCDVPSSKSLGLFSLRFTLAANQSIFIFWLNFISFWLLTPWISLSHLLLHLLLLFRIKVPAENRAGSGGRRQGKLGRSEHRKNKKYQISNPLWKHQC